MWPTSWAMRPSRRSDSTALAETNRVCRSDVDFDAPMIAMRAISAVTGSRRESPWEAYFSVTSSNAVLTSRVPPRPVRSMTATSTSFSRRRPMINLQGATSTKLSKRRLAGGRRRRADELSTSHVTRNPDSRPWALPVRTRRIVDRRVISLTVFDNLIERVPSAWSLGWEGCAKVRFSRTACELVGSPNRAGTKSLSDIVRLIGPSLFRCSCGHEEARGRDGCEDPDAGRGGGEPAPGEPPERTVREVPSVLPGQDRDRAARARADLQRLRNLV